MTKKVFISYAHETEELSNNVLEFSNYMREKGIDSEIDQYEESPSEGWPKWMMRQIQEADTVLVCCSKLFFDRSNDFSGEESGLGVKWETNLILQQLYSSNTNNNKFIPIFFEDENKQHIPLPLQPYTHYQVSKDEEKEKLKNRILGLSQSKRPPLGKAAETIEDHEKLEPKERKSMFFSSIIDLDLWNKGGWKGMAFMSDPGLKMPPLACFVFENEEVGNEIFSNLKKEFGKEDSEEEIRLCFIEKVSSQNPLDYKVHFGSYPEAIFKKFEKYGIEPESTLLTLLSRVHEMNPPKKPSSLEVFKHAYNYFKFYGITNAVIEDGQIQPNFINAIKKTKVHFRTKDEILKDGSDVDISAFPEFNIENLTKKSR